MAHPEGSMDLDRLIQSCEFENQQYVKLIEKENQQINALDKDIEEKQREGQKLEEAISQLDEDTKRAHKQFTVNRDNYDSLRKTMVVLMEHEVALHRKHNCLITNGEEERLQREGVVKHYQGIYTDYMAKYNTFPLVKDLAHLQEKVDAKRKLLDEAEETISSLQTQIDRVQGSSEVNFKNLHKFIIKVAELRLDSESAVTEKKHFEAELQEIQKRNTKQDNDGDQQDSDDKMVVNITEDSFGEDVSPMIGMFHNKAEEQVHGYKNMNNSADAIHPVTESVPPAPVLSISKVATSSPIPVSIPPSEPQSCSRQESVQIFTSPVLVHRESDAVASPAVSRPSPQVPVMGIRAISASPVLQSAGKRPPPVLMPNLIPVSRPSMAPRIEMSPRFCLQNLKIRQGLNSVQAMECDSGASPLPCRTRPIQEPRRSLLQPSPLSSMETRKLLHASPKIPQLPKGYMQMASPEASTVSRFVSPVNLPLAAKALQAGSHVPDKPLSVPSSPAQNVFTASRQLQETASSLETASCTDIQDTDVPMESPEKSTKSPKTPRGHSDTEGNSKSPFNLKKHLQQIDMLSKSPGSPMYSQRPMFDSGNVQVDAKSPGPFLQTFSLKPTTPSSNGQEATTDFSMNLFRPGSEMKELFAPPETQETTFISEAGQQDKSKSVFTMFASNEKSPDPKTASDNFCFNFGSRGSPLDTSKTSEQFAFSFGSDQTSPKSTDQEFSFSFGGCAGDDRSPSVFNLF